MSSTVQTIGRAGSISAGLLQGSVLRLLDTGTRAVPGIMLCAVVSLAALAVDRAQAHWLGHVWLEALVVAILIGTGLRSLWTPGARWAPGIAVSAKLLLETAIVLLGASLSARTMLAAGPALPAGIACVVLLAIGGGYGVGRLLGLPHRLATLVACGNAICGNSAIAAVAPAIGAHGDEVSASIAFTAVLGVLVVLVLPCAIPLLHLNTLQFGAFAGLTVYAVPQVLAAAAPAGAAAVQFGTLVKLIRVLMLGPVVLGLTLLARRRGKQAATPVRGLLPWFIVGFIVMAAARSAGRVPEAALGPMAGAAGALTVVSMAALGLSTDLRMVARSGLRVTAAVTLSLIGLAVLSIGVIRALGVA